MTNHGDDCYFYYYSTCTKGNSCPFRHCEAAMGSETVCSRWQENSCFRSICKFRHMEIQKKRNEIACYWENQPAGCQKPHCAFHHEKPRMIDGVFVPPNKVPFLRKEAEEEPAPLADPSSPAPVPVNNPANPQLRGVIKAETLENVPSPTHPPVVINPVDDEDEDEDDQFSEEGEESSSRMVSPRKLISNASNDDSMNFGIKTLEEIKLRKALKANLKKAGQSITNLSQGTGCSIPPGQRSNGSSLEKENIRSFMRPSLVTVMGDAPLQNEEPAKRHIADRLGKRKATLTGEQVFIIKKDLPKGGVSGRRADLSPQKAVKPVRDRLGFLGEPAETSETESAREAKPSGEVRIKTLEEIRQEKAAMSQGRGKGPAGAKPPSPVKKSGRPSAGVHVKTFSEVLHAKKKQEEQQKAADVEQATEGGSSGKAATRSAEVRVKTLEQIRKEKAARMQAKGQEAKTEESPGSGSVLPKRRILLVNKTAAVEAAGTSNPKTPEATEKPTEPVTPETGSSNEKRGLSGENVKVKTFEEIMREKRLRKQQEEQTASSVQPEDPSPSSAPKRQEPTPQGERPLATFPQRVAAVPQSNEPPIQPKITPMAGRQRITFRQKEPDSEPAATPTVASPQAQARSPSANAGDINPPPAKQKRASPPAPPADRMAPPNFPQEKPQAERMQGAAPKKSPAQTAETKVRHKLNVKPSVKAATQVKLGQKRKTPEAHRSAVAAVKPLNSAPAAEEDQAQEPSCKRAEMSAPSESLEIDVQVCPLGPKLSIPECSLPAISSTSQAEVHRDPITEQSIVTPEPVVSPAKEPCAIPQSPVAEKTPTQPKSRRQSSVTLRATTPAALDDLDELMNEFADDPLDGEIELDPAKDEDDLLMELSEMIGS
ncbi:hypothetical protein AAFF_G00398980 [Aldrovandia affinis]|uniref:C3H1-type domain-containing protein n=1 Tax=Aldrovandia affinis TaxID=143900 RepID=A0AAD7SD00_9TELE|nr:hypothetical protein AAFF_G00398980 [Aldrovandia affinis]